jgi:hypothetical protein
LESSNSDFGCQILDFRFFQSAIRDLQFEMKKEFILKVYLQPKSSKNEMVGPYRDGIKVKVTAPPVEGKANEALIKLLAKEFGISPSSIEIIKGGHAREKVLKISSDMDQEWLKKQLQDGQSCCSGEDVSQHDHMRKKRQSRPTRAGQEEDLERSFHRH